MFRNIFQSEVILSVLGIVALVCFFLSFLFVLLYSWKMEKKFSDKMSNLPLEENNFSRNK